MKPGPKARTRGEALVHLLSRCEIGDCWIWTGATAKGYGKALVEGRYVLVHRFVYEMLVGLVDGPMDHRCRNILCCNPDHLEPVSARVNTLRSCAPNTRRQRTSTCLRGHDLHLAWIAKNGTRKCRQCNTIRQAERRARLKAAL